MEEWVAVELCLHFTAHAQKRSFSMHKMAEEAPMKTITFEEVKNHNKAGGCWLVIHDNVYDVTKFLDEVKS